MPITEHSVYMDSCFFRQYLVLNSWSPCKMHYRTHCAKNFWPEQWTFHATYSTDTAQLSTRHVLDSVALSIMWGYVLLLALSIKTAYITQTSGNSPELTQCISPCNVSTHWKNFPIFYKAFRSQRKWSLHAQLSYLRPNFLLQLYILMWHSLIFLVYFVTDFFDLLHLLLLLETSWSTDY